MEGYGNDNPGAFQSSPSVRKATGLHQVSDKVTDISIPAFREEGDNKFQQEIAKTQGIKQPFLQTVTRNHSLSGKNPKVD